MDRDTQRLVAYHTHISWQAPSKRSIWMDGRILPTMRLTHGRALDGKNGRETSSPSRPTTSRKAGFGETAFPEATKPL